MNAADVVLFLSGDASGHDLQAKIGPEVREWADRLRERGRSAAIILTGMNGTFDVTPNRAVRLLDAFLSSELTQESFAYILDALLLDERFRWTSHLARESLETIIGPESKRELDKRKAWKAREELRVLSKS
jgi:hypothetical protein